MLYLRNMMDFTHKKCGEPSSTKLRIQPSKFWEFNQTLQIQRYHYLTKLWIEEENLEVKLPTIWTHEKQRWEEMRREGKRSEGKRSEAKRIEEKRRKKINQEKARRKKIQVREKVGQPRNTVCF